MTDFRDAFRALRATPVVSAVAILSLALGIGANTAIFSLVNSLMLRSLPVKEPQQLVQVMGGSTRASWSNPLWEQLRDQHQSLFNGAFAYTTQRYNLARGGEAQMVSGIMASGRFFEVLGVPAILGRTFTTDNDIRRGPGTENRQVAVLSYAYWQRHYGGAADVLGKTIELDRIPFTIVGVTPPEFTGVDQGQAYEVAIPLAAEVLMRGSEKESAMDQRTWWWIRIMARLKPGDTMDRAVTAFRGVQPQMRQATIPDNYRPKDLPNYLKDPFTLRAAANGPNGLGRQYKDPLYLDHGGRGAGAAHRVRQHREPAARARQRAAARAQRARRPRRVALADRAPAPRGERAALGLRHGARPAARAVGRAPAGARDVGPGDRERPGRRTGLARPALHRRDRRRHGAALRDRAGACARHVCRPTTRSRSRGDRSSASRASASAACSWSRRWRCRWC